MRKQSARIDTLLWLANQQFLWSNIYLWLPYAYQACAIVISGAAFHYTSLYVARHRQPASLRRAITRHFTTCKNFCYLNNK